MKKTVLINVRYVLYSLLKYYWEKESPVDEIIKELQKHTFLVPELRPLLKRRSNITRAWEEEKGDKELMKLIFLLHYRWRNVAIGKGIKVHYTTSDVVKQIGVIQSKGWRRKTA